MDSGMLYALMKKLLPSLFAMVLAPVALFAGEFPDISHDEL